MNFLINLIRGLWIKDYTFFELFFFYIIFTFNLEWWHTLICIIGIIFANNFLMDVLNTKNEHR